WPEFIDTWKQGIEMLREVPHTVHALVMHMPDVPRAYLPPNSLTGLASLLRNLPANAGISVTVMRDSDARIAQAIFDAVRHITPAFVRRAVLVTSIEEALAEFAAYVPDTES
ncbi:MAG: hypothetical protein K8I30_10360, partial [Anaerolineae bacterium]|nr:hypothetical protein [Anaerolineae bacterium]